MAIMLTTRSDNTPDDMENINWKTSRATHLTWIEMVGGYWWVGLGRFDTTWLMAQGFLLEILMLFSKGFWSSIRSNEVEETENVSSKIVILTSKVSCKISFCQMANYIRPHSTTSILQSSGLFCQWFFFHHLNHRMSQQPLPTAVSKICCRRCTWEGCFCQNPSDRLERCGHVIPPKDMGTERKHMKSW